MAAVEVQSFIPTKCTAVRKAAVANFQVVVHEKKRKLNEKSNIKINKTKDSKIERNEMDMKKVRYEVFKFGMSGFKPEKKEEVKVALAVSLGARPPRNKGYNYKEYKIMKESRKKEQLEQQKLLAAGKTKTGKANTKGKKKSVTGKSKMKKDGILDPYGKPGKVRTAAKLRRR